MTTEARPEDIVRAVDAAPNAVKRELVARIDTLLTADVQGVRLYEWIPPCETENGAMQLGYPNYGDILWSALAGVFDVVFHRNSGFTRITSPRTLDTHDDVADADIGEMCAYTLFVVTHERIADGTVAALVDDGTLQHLLRRIRDHLDLSGRAPPGRS